MTTHVDDGALIRYLDREEGPPDRADVARHLGECDRCASRYAQLEGAARALSMALRASALRGVPKGASRRWWWRAAAAALAMASVAGAVRPVRAWIVERAETLWQTVTGHGDHQQAPSLARPGRVPSVAAAFVPSGDEFTVEVTGDPAGGTLRIETVAGDTATAVVFGGSGSEDVVVLPTGLRIVAPQASTASYVVRLPSQLDRVWITVGAGGREEYRPDDSPVEIPLGQRRP